MAAITHDAPARAAPRAPRALGYALPGLLLLALFFVVPVSMLLVRSVLEPEPGLGNYAQLLGSSTYLRIFYNTFLVSAVVTVLAVVIGFPVAWMLAIMPGRWSAIVFAIILLSMWTNLLARTYAWMVLLQRTGLINRTLMNLGIIDQPLALPGVVAGALMVFVMSLGYFVTPALLGGTANMMLAELIAQFVQSLVNWGMGAAAAFVLLVITLALYALQLRLFGTGRMGGV